jgi:hypothetical protein
MMVVSLTQSGSFHIFRQPFSYRLDRDVIFLPVRFLGRVIELKQN